MNLLEHYILEVYDVKTVDMGDWSYVQVDMMVICYGRKSRVKGCFANMAEWEKVKEKKCYMA